MSVRLRRAFEWNYAAPFGRSDTYVTCTHQSRGEAARLPHLTPSQSHPAPSSEEREHRLGTQGYGSMNGSNKIAPAIVVADR